MGRVFYDDGSYLDTLDDGTTIGYNTAGVAVNKVEADGDYFRSPGYWQDARESQKLNPYTAAPAGSEGMAWWERLAQYGATRAIDAQFGPPATNKTSAGGTFAGQNGRTYTTQGGNAQPGQGGSILPVVIAGVVALLALA